MKIKLILKENNDIFSTIDSKLKELNRINTTNKPVYFADLFNKLFSPEEYKFLPYVIEKTDNYVMAWQLVHRVHHIIGKELSIKLYNFASQDSLVKKYMDKYNLDKVINDDGWYEQ